MESRQPTTQYHCILTCSSVVHVCFQWSFCSGPAWWVHTWAAWQRMSSCILPVNLATLSCQMPMPRGAPSCHRRRILTAWSSSEGRQGPWREMWGFLVTMVFRVLCFCFHWNVCFIYWCLVFVFLLNLLFIILNIVLDFLWNALGFPCKVARCMNAFNLAFAFQFLYALNHFSYVSLNFFVIFL